MKPYRGRIAPSPTGYLHLGHAQTFWSATQRARRAEGTLIYRTEDLDPQRCKAEYSQAAMEDLRWIGIDWDEGPEKGGDYGPYVQSLRTDRYREVLELLKMQRLAYPCRCSRKDVMESAIAPHETGDEPIYGGTCRPTLGQARRFDPSSEERVNWRFRLPEIENIEFHDGGFGSQSFRTNSDFGDFVLWRHDDIPSYQLAVVVDDHDMKITEVVRGADLLKCTARQILLYHALGWDTPDFFHCPLVTDETGERLAKRTDALSLRSMRESGQTPEAVLRQFQH